MIDFFFGKPRSGKSYRAMDMIYNEYIAKSDSIPKFKNILTNIGGFKFDEVNKIFLARGSVSVAYRLVWKQFYPHLKEMYSMAMDDKSDDELNDYADLHKINDCLIVLDEASLYMKKYDDVISWWLAYHGHFRIRIICIAQNPKQIYAEYMTHTEIYYEAQPQSKQLKNNSLRYVHYDDIPFNKNSKFSSNTIKTKKEVYALYKSGEIDKPKKIIYKFIFIAVIAILAIFLLSKIFVGKIKSEAGIDESDSVSNLSSNSSSFDSSKTIITFRCNNKNCWLPSNKYIYRTISKTYLKYVLLKNDVKLLYFETNNEIYKLQNLKKGQKKIVLASLVDYFYLMPNDVKNVYFSDLFQLQKIQQNTNINTSKNLQTTDNIDKSNVTRSD